MALTADLLFLVAALFSLLHPKHPKGASPSPPQHRSREFSAQPATLNCHLIPWGAVFPARLQGESAIVNSAQEAFDRPQKLPRKRTS